MTLESFLALFPQEYKVTAENVYEAFVAANPFLEALSNAYDPAEARLADLDSLFNSLTPEQRNINIANLEALIGTYPQAFLLAELNDILLIARCRFEHPALILSYMKVLDARTITAICTLIIMLMEAKAKGNSKGIGFITLPPSLALPAGLRPANIICLPDFFKVIDRIVSKIASNPQLAITEAYDRVLEIFYVISSFNIQYVNTTGIAYLNSDESTIILGLLEKFPNFLIPLLGDLVKIKKWHDQNRHIPFNINDKVISLLIISMHPNLPDKLRLLASCSQLTTRQALKNLSIALRIIDTPYANLMLGYLCLYYYHNPRAAQLYLSKVPKEAEFYYVNALILLATIETLKQKLSTARLLLKDGGLSTKDLDLAFAKLPRVCWQQMMLVYMHPYKASLPSCPPYNLRATLFSYPTAKKASDTDDPHSALVKSFRK